MVCKEIDILSPQITLYNKGLLYHSSKISVILSIIAIILIFFSFIINFVMFYFKVETPKMNSYFIFVEDSGNIQISHSNLFHYINIYNKSSSKKEFDFESFRIIGFDTYLDNYLNNKNLSSIDHWLYGPCNKIDIPYNNSIPEEDFSNSACIKKYFNSKKQKYIDINEENYKWPEMAEGNINFQKKFYSVIVEKCEKNTLNLIFENNKKECKSEIELENIIKNEFIQFNFIDQEIKMENYRDPINKYIYRLETKLSLDNYIINHLYFIPVILNTTVGIFGNSIDMQYTYMFDRENFYIHKNNGENFFIGYYIWYRKSMKIYQRVYSKLADFISDIGGTSNVIISVFYFINKLFNKYAMLTDTHEYFNSSSQPLKRIKILKLEHQLKYLKTQNFKSNTSLSYMKEEKPLANNETNELYSKSENINNKTFVNENSFKYEDSNIIENKKRNNNINKKDDNMKVNNNKIEKIKFCTYFLNKISFGKLYKNLEIYEDFRIKVISVENLMNNYLNIDNLIKVNYMNKNK